MDSAKGSWGQQIFKGNCRQGSLPDRDESGEVQQGIFVMQLLLIVLSMSDVGVAT